VPSPSPNDTPVPRDGPEIKEIDLSDSVVVSPGDLHVRVLTSRSVVRVIAEAMGNDLTIPLQTPGVFIFDGYVPNAPAFMRDRSFDVSFIATAADGRSATVTLPLTLR